MTCLLLSLALIAVAAGLAIAIVARQGTGSWDLPFQQVARRFHGAWHAGGWFSPPAVWIRRGESQSRLSLVTLPGPGREPCLQLTLQQRDITLRCEIFSHAARPSLVPPPQGLIAVHVGDDAFSAHWQVWSDEPDQAQKLITEGVRLAIEQLWQAVPGERGNTAISLARGWLIVRSAGASPRSIQLEDYVERIFRLSDQLSLAAAAGINFVASDEPQLLEDARCGVCGDALAEDIVVCRRCNTPHHRDCWQFTGGCATYACGGREFAAPRVAAVVEQEGDQGDWLKKRPMKPR